MVHIILIATGGGAMRAEARTLRFEAPCLLLVPAGTVHGFHWHEESTGHVVTMATRYLADLARHDPDIAALFVQADAVALGEEDGARAERLMGELMQELAWSARGHRAAVDAALLSIAVVALRHVDHGPARRQPGAGHQAGTVARLRERIEQRFRLREPVATHAAALGVSETALRVACAKLAGTSPAMMLDQRALLEARRALLYSNLSIAEIAYSIGFSDPAYFSRFFTHHVGRSPRRYREERGD